MILTAKLSIFQRYICILQFCFWKPSDSLFYEHALALFLLLSGDELAEKLYKKKNVLRF